MTFGGAGSDIINDMVEVHELFPTPVYLVNLSTIREHEYKESELYQSIKRVDNVGNVSSEDKQVLNMKCFSRVKFEIDRHLKNYYQIIHSPINDVNPYVSLSWLNWTKDNQFHHYHAHQNSLVSGVFYIECEDSDSITFNLDRYRPILIDTDKPNPFNTFKYTLPLQKHDLVLFPSSLIHGVDDKPENDRERISLSFNSFIRGTIGSEVNSTKLVL